MDAMSNPQPSPYGPAGQPPRPPAAGFFDSLRRTGLVRTRDRWVGGVAGGVARRLGVDPVLVRCVWIVLCVFTGLGLLLYGLGWALLPEEEDGRIHAQQALTGDLTAGLSGAVFVTIGGLSSTDTGLVPHWWVRAWDSSLGGAVAAILWTVLIVGCVYWGIRAAGRHRERRQGRGGQPGQQATWAQAQHQPGQPVNPSQESYSIPSAAAWQAAPQSAPSAGPVDAPGSTAHGEPPADGRTSSAPWTTGAPVPPTSGSAPATWSGVSTPGRPGPAPAYPGAVPPGTAPQAWGAQPPAPAPRRPRRPKRPGPGRRTSLLVLGVSLLALAAVGVLLAAGRMHAIAAGLAAVGVLVTGLGAGVLASGLRGRRGGWMSWLAWPVLALLAVPALVLSTSLPTGAVNAPLTSGLVALQPTASQIDEAWQTTGSRTINVGPYSAGSVSLDLRNLGELTDDATINVTVGTGNLQILTTQGQALRLETSSGVGTLNADLAEEWQVSGGVQSTGFTWGLYNTYDVNGRKDDGAKVWANNPLHPTTTLTSPPARTGSTPVLTIRAALGSGMLSVEERADHVQWSGVEYPDYWVVDEWTDSNGGSHDGDELPVEGMTHRAVSADVLETCIEDVVTDSMTEDGTYIDVTNLGELPSSQREKVDACVDAAITAGGGTTATAAPSDAPSTDPSSTPTSSPTASATTAPATPTLTATTH